MAAYVIFFVEKTRDPQKIAAYRARVRATLEGHNATVRILHGHRDVVEGAPMEEIAMLEFPTFEEAQNWYRSPAYQDVVALRFAGADCRAVIVQGV
ncbi:MAG TPA: DUF1330 domain-containing protein [Rhizomicrobium sp.]|nr:DUF1330 domain-containing protein [Rhizomicrobium sp.]